MYGLGLTTPRISRNTIELYLPGSLYSLYIPICLRFLVWGSDQDPSIMGEGRLQKIGAWGFSRGFNLHPKVVPLNLGPFCKILKVV